MLAASHGRCHGGSGQLATANPDGSQCEVLTAASDAADPAVNAAGDTIAFTRTGAGTSSIYLVGADGRDQRLLVGGPGRASGPAWSPDGTRIAFADDRSGTAQIYVADASTGAVMAQLTTGSSASTQPAWSPDGKQIAYINSGRLFVMRADGSAQRPLTAAHAAARTPAWSPNGQRLAFASDELTAGRFQIYVVRPDGSGKARVTHDGASDQQPAWSPDSRLMAFTRSAMGGNTVALVPAPGRTGSGPLPLFPGTHPTWARLPPPATPVPGVLINASPKGNVEVQPAGSSLAEPLNGPVSVSVRPDAPTIFRPRRGGSVQLSTRLRGGRSAAIRISGGAVAVSQPGGKSTRIVLLGNSTAHCPAPSTAKPAYIRGGGVLSWRITDRGHGHPHAVHGKANLYFRGTDASIHDLCRGADGLQEIRVVVFKGVVVLSGIPMKPGSPSSGSGCTSSDGFIPALSRRVLEILHSRGSGHFRRKGCYASGTVRG